MLKKFINNLKWKCSFIQYSILYTSDNVGVFYNSSFEEDISNNGFMS